MMYPPSAQVLVPLASRKYRPLPFRPSQSHDRNGNSSLALSYTSTAHSRRINGSSTKESKRDDIVEPRVLSESENISGRTPPNGAEVANQPLYRNQWKKLGIIGKGSYGQVYRALDITTGYIFAVKEINSKMKRRTLVEALQVERETLKELEHPNIVRYLGFGEDEGVLNIFLEYVPGGTIRSCLTTHGKFKEEVTKSFTSQILRGLSYLHSKSILHRDLKSENILVEPQGICKISDFGISKKALEADRGRLYSIMKGTIAYMAPEMIDNENKGYDSKIDIWSVGCIVFEMWTGKTPWNGSQDVQILIKLFTTEKLAASPGPPLPDDILLSPTAESFRREFFHFVPEKRPSAVKLLQHVYLKLPPQWAFPGVEEMGQASVPSSESIALCNNFVKPSHNDTGKGTQFPMKVREDQNSIFESIYSEIKAITAEINLATNHERRSPSLSQTTYSDVVNPQEFNPPMISITPPLRPRKKRRNSNLGAHTPTTSPNTVSHAPPLDTSSERRPYVYHPPPLPEMNVLLPYSRHLVPPITMRSSKPISQTFSNGIKPVPTKLLTLSTDVSSVGISVARNVDYSGERGVPYILPSKGEVDDSDDDDCYSPSIWKRPPLDIPSGPSNNVKPVESVSDWNISTILPPSAIPRPSVETVYKGFLSENVENIDLSDARIASRVSSKNRYTMKSIRDVVEARLSQAQIVPETKAHFWNSHMEEIRPARSPSAWVAGSLFLNLD